jgi:hypothetical protein
MNRKFGRGYLPDSRDHRYMIRSPFTNRTYRHWRLNSEVTDQGETSACVGHAWYNWLGASPVRQVPLLPNGLYELARHYDEWEGEDYDGTSVRGAAKVLKLTGHVVEYVWEWQLDPIANYLLEQGPVVLGVNWYGGMYNPDKNGLIKPTGRVLGGHAVLAYGINIKKELVWIRNSWGKGWGINGNCLISLDDLAQLLGEDGECCSATERKP